MFNEDDLIYPIRNKKYLDRIIININIPNIEDFRDEYFKTYDALMQERNRRPFRVLGKSGPLYRRRSFKEGGYFTSKVAKMLNDAYNDLLEEIKDTLDYVGNERTVFRIRLEIIVSNNMVIAAFKARYWYNDNTDDGWIGSHKIYVEEQMVGDSYPGIGHPDLDDDIDIQIKVLFNLVLDKRYRKSKTFNVDYLTYNT